MDAMSTPLDHRDDYGSDDWLWETASDRREEFYRQASPEEAAAQAASDGWRP